MHHLVLESLPVDILLQIFGALEVSDILAIRCTNKFFQSITHEHSIWHEVLHTQVVQRGIPLPGLRDRSITTLSAAQLEHLACNALRLRANWTSAIPVCTRHVDIIPLKIRSSRTRNISVQFLPGRGNRYLLAITLYDDPAEPRKCMIQCWDITSENPQKCVQVAMMLCVGVHGVTVNSDPNHAAVLAVTRRGPAEEVTTSMFAIKFNAECPEKAFVLLDKFPSFRFPLAFEGSVFIASEVNQIVYLINTDSGRVTHELHVPLLHDDATLLLEEHKCFQAILLEHFVLTFRKQWLYIYHIPPEEPVVASPADGPFIVHSIPSPIRLFTPSDMVLGRYGTALWIDAATDETTPSQAGDHGQRIVGKMLSHPQWRTAGLPLGGEGSSDDRVSPGYVDARIGTELANVNDGALTDEAMASTMVFQLQELPDEWNRLCIG
ncbi:hypothetical protein A0H81_06257 [Grifola frondosa]|uniref:F-box domain-containing protein n=1 Tax=Grifola frondosa TaxID=5627 RepID=A0A1C7M9V6_GRIFR|nr:hypothetical protein A0H81_06257 [Grifola frondosa]